MSYRLSICLLIQVASLVWSDEYFNCPKWPNVLILGTQKAGTSTLYESLNLHPNICQASGEEGEPHWRLKELHFFDEQLEQGPQYYCQKFAACSSHQKGMEGTPNYLNFDMARRMQQTFSPEDRSQMKLIAVLRDPVERLLSWYNHVIAVTALEDTTDADFAETAWYHEYLRDNYQTNQPANSGVRDANITIPLEGSDFLTFEETFLTNKYSVDLGKYIDILEEYFQAFDKQNILILNFDYMMNYPAKTMNIVSEFIGIDSIWDDEFAFEQINSQEHAGKLKMSQIGCDTAKELYDFYKPYNVKLFYTLFKNRDKFWEGQPYFKQFKNLPKCAGEEKW